MFPLLDPWPEMPKSRHSPFAFFLEDRTRAPVALGQPWLDTNLQGCVRYRHLMLICRYLGNFLRCTDKSRSEVRSGPGTKRALAKDMCSTWQKKLSLLMRWQDPKQVSGDGNIDRLKE